MRPVRPVAADSLLIVERGSRSPILAEKLTVSRASNTEWRVFSFPHQTFPITGLVVGCFKLAYTTCLERAAPVALFRSRFSCAFEPVPTASSTFRRLAFVALVDAGVASMRSRSPGAPEICPATLAACHFAGRRHVARTIQDFISKTDPRQQAQPRYFFFASIPAISRLTASAPACWASNGIERLGAGTPLSLPCGSASPDSIRRITIVNTSSYVLAAPLRRRCVVYSLKFCDQPASSRRCWRVSRMRLIPPLPRSASLTWSCTSGCQPEVSPLTSTFFC